MSPGLTGPFIGLGKREMESRLERGDERGEREGEKEREGGRDRFLSTEEKQNTYLVVVVSSVGTCEERLSDESVRS